MYRSNCRRFRRKRVAIFRYIFSQDDTAFVYHHPHMPHHQILLPQQHFTISNKPSPLCKSALISLDLTLLPLLSISYPRPSYHLKYVSINLRCFVSLEQPFPARFEAITTRLQSLETSAHSTQRPTNHPSILIFPNTLQRLYCSKPLKIPSPVVLKP